jgi:hypothetical protein
MNSIVELPVKACAAPPIGRHRGLRKLPPDLISKARDETADRVTRIGLTFLGITAFCLLSLLSPDSALLGGTEKISVPLVGPVSFSGFMLLGPAFLIVIRVYLQIYVEHSERLDRLARAMPTLRAPNLVPLQIPLIRFSSGLIFYLLLPLTMILFALKAAVFPGWGLNLLCVALGVIGSHVMLWLNRFHRLWPLPLKVLTTVLAVFAVLSVVFSLGLVEPDLHPPGGPPGVRRPFNLASANLSGQWLYRADFRGAQLHGANLSHANLWSANLRDAFLRDADLRDADLRDADLRDADLLGVDLSGATLRAAKNLTQTQLDGACGAPSAAIAFLPPEGLTVKPCQEPTTPQWDAVWWIAGIVFANIGMLIGILVVAPVLCIARRGMTARWRRTRLLGSWRGGSTV